MPFELGLAVAHAKQNSQHTFYVFEEMKQRLSKSLSDLDGTDVYIHGATLNGLFAQLSDAFVRADRQPTVAQMWTIYRELRALLPRSSKSQGQTRSFVPAPLLVFRPLPALLQITWYPNKALAYSSSSASPVLAALAAATIFSCAACGTMS